MYSPQPTDRTARYTRTQGSSTGIVQGHGLLQASFTYKPQEFEQAPSPYFLFHETDKVCGQHEDKWGRPCDVHGLGPRVEKELSEHEHKEDI